MRRLALTLTLAVLAGCGPAKSKVISTGDAVKKEDYAIPGKVVVLEFMAKG